MSQTINMGRIAALAEGAVPDGVDCTTAAAVFGGGTAIELESALFLYGLVRRIQPRIVVETGTNWGFSSAWIASALADSAELYPRKEPLHGHLWTIDSSAYEDRGPKLWDRLGLSSYVTAVRGDSRTLGTLPPLPGPIDFLYLDADHGEDAVLAEWDILAPLLNPKGAVVAFHDTRLDPREAEAIRIILEEYRHPLERYGTIAHVAMRNFRGLDYFQLRP